MPNRDKRLNVKMSQEEMDAIREACILFDMSVAEYIRLVALKPARAFLTNDISTVSATAELQERYLENAVKLRKGAGETDETKDDT